MILATGDYSSSFAPGLAQQPNQLMPQLPCGSYISQYSSQLHLHIMGVDDITLSSVSAVMNLDVNDLPAFAILAGQPLTVHITIHYQRQSLISRLLVYNTPLSLVFQRSVNTRGIWTMTCSG
jgi:hypothetical protein